MQQKGRVQEKKLKDSGLLKGLQFTSAPAGRTACLPTVSQMPGPPNLPLGGGGWWRGSPDDYIAFLQDLPSPLAQLCRYDADITEAHIVELKAMFIA